MKRGLFVMCFLMPLGIARAETTEIAQSNVTATGLTETAKKNVVSLHLLSISAHVFSGEYERKLFPKISLVGAIGGRHTAGGDYTAHTYAFGGGARYWFTGGAVGSAAPSRSMIGPYLGARIDVALGTIESRNSDEKLPGSTTISGTLVAGYRFALWKRLEITPSIGITRRIEFDNSGRLPPWSRGAIDAGLTAGWLF